MGDVIVISSDSDSDEPIFSSRQHDVFEGEENKGIENLNSISIPQTSKTTPTSKQRLALPAVNGHIKMYDSYQMLKEDVLRTLGRYPSEPAPHEVSVNNMFGTNELPVLKLVRLPNVKPSSIVSSTHKQAKPMWSVSPDWEMKGKGTLTESKEVSVGTVFSGKLEEIVSETQLSCRPANSVSSSKDLSEATVEEDRDQEHHFCASPSTSKDSFDPNSSCRMSANSVSSSKDLSEATVEEDTDQEHHFCASPSTSKDSFDPNSSCRTSANSVSSSKDLSEATVEEDRDQEHHFCASPSTSKDSFDPNSSCRMSANSVSSSKDLSEATVEEDTDQEHHFCASPSTSKDSFDPNSSCRTSANSVSSSKDLSEATVEEERDQEHHFCASPSTSKDSFDPNSSCHTSDKLTSYENPMKHKEESRQIKQEVCSSPPSEKCSSVDGDFEEEDCVCYEDYPSNDSPLFMDWGNEDVKLESRSDEESSDSLQADKQFVCPVALKQIMEGQSLAPPTEETVAPPQLIPRQMQRLIQCTIEENHTEGTLELLLDFSQPGYYPPKSISEHLLCVILLNPLSSRRHCVCAFNLLMKTQRHHMVNVDTVPWSWDLLASVMNNENPSQKIRSEVARMFLEYVLQTLTDDYFERLANSDLGNSIAKATLSCYRHLSQVRDVIKWICSGVVRSCEGGKTLEAARERDEQMRIVSTLQRMLSLALDVDQTPALVSSKLSQELFNTVITSLTPPAHRKMFLETLQSPPLRCKLVEQLLEYSSAVKVSLPMSLSLLLHFLTTCSPVPDCKGGEERWRGWEELLQLLWMLLLSYNKTMKGYLSRSTRGNVSGRNIFKQEDRITKTSVFEAVKAFQSRSRKDLDDSLPFHVEELLSYLLDYLLESCQD